MAPQRQAAPGWEWDGTDGVLSRAGGLPGEVMPDGAGRRRVFDELGRWLSAYLSGQIRDQLL